MRVTIYQPQYFPILHYFNRILESDTYVVLESAQYTKVLNHFVGGKREKHKSYQSHSPIKMAEGEYFLTVPVKNEPFLPINKASLDYDQNWGKKHLRTIQAGYGRSPKFSKIFSDLEKLLSQKYATLAELNLKTTIWGISKVLEFNVPVEQLTLVEINKSLENNSKVRLDKILLDKETTGSPEGTQKGDDWILNICKSIGATEHVHGETSKVGYMDIDRYKKLGINPITQDWQCQKYVQQFEDKNGFLANLSILDLLFNTDYTQSYNILVSEFVKMD